MFRIHSKLHPATRYATYYDVIFRRFRITVVAVEKQEVLHILSVCL